MAGAQAHGLVLSFPMQGHINPLLQLSSRLAAVCGCAITLVLTDFEYAHAKRRQKEQRNKKKKGRNQKHKGFGSSNKNKKELEDLRQQNSDEKGGGGGGGKDDYDDSASAKEEEEEEEEEEEDDDDAAAAAEDVDIDGGGSGVDDDDDDEDLTFGLPGCVRLVGVPDKLPHSSSRTGGAEFRDSYDALVNMQEGVEKLLAELRSSNLANPVSFILADTFVHWAHLVARQFDLPLFSFFTSNVASALIFLHAPSLVAEGVLPFREEDDKPISKDPVTSIPGLPPIRPCDFPRCFTFAPSHYRFSLLPGPLTL